MKNYDPNSDFHKIDAAIKLGKIRLTALRKLYKSEASKDLDYDLDTEFADQLLDLIEETKSELARLKRMRKAVELEGHNSFDYRWHSQLSHLVDRFLNLSLVLILISCILYIILR